MKEDGQSLKVLHEDAALIVVEKPAGIHTAPLHAGETDNLLARVLAAFPAVCSVPGIKPFEHGLLHRLDRDTSGVVVIARTPSAFEALRLQFLAQEARKEYHAVCACAEDSNCAEDRSPAELITIQSMFAPAGPGRRKVRVVMPEEKNKKLLREAAPTVYRTEARIERLQGSRALVFAVIQKGFRHQIRAHLAFTGLPIFGDDLYGVPVPPGAEQRMYLHASAIQLISPASGKQLRVISPPPESFLALV
jgi:23S rRNA pseudouridine1911/1915/1917 synthase